MDIFELVVHVYNSLHEKCITTAQVCIKLLVHAAFANSQSVCVDLFVLKFYSPVNPMGSCRVWSVWSVYQTTLLLGRLSPLCGLPFLCT